ncbi:MAG: hypothetical protein M1826_002276 [Phylliscum demangeonii]|nr:MAG: hypothetical protein M1826_002276 [Phylliscum demangeonii]
MDEIEFAPALENPMNRYELGFTTFTFFSWLVDSSHRQYQPGFLDQAHGGNEIEFTPALNSFSDLSSSRTGGVGINLSRGQRLVTCLGSFLFLSKFQSRPTVLSQDPVHPGLRADEAYQNDQEEFLRILRAAERKQEGGRVSAIQTLLVGRLNLNKDLNDIMERLVPMIEVSARKNSQDCVGFAFQVGKLVESWESASTTEATLQSSYLTTSDGSYSIHPLETDPIVYCDVPGESFDGSDQGSSEAAEGAAEQPDNVEPASNATTQESGNASDYDATEASGDRSEALALPAIGDEFQSVKGVRWKRTAAGLESDRRRFEVVAAAEMAERTCRTAFALPDILLLLR